MSESVQPEPAAAPSVYPYSWLNLIIAFAGLAIGGIAAVALVVQFLSSRPYDLVDVSRHGAETLEEVLAANGVASERIEATQPVPRRTAEAQFLYYEYDVSVPSTVNDAGLVKLIHRTLGKEGISVTDLLEEGQKAGVSLAAGEHTIAVVRMHVEAGRPPTSFAASEHKDIKLEANSENPVRELPHDVMETARTARTQPADSTTPLEASDLPQPAVVPAATPEDEKRLAIVVDDGGYGGEPTEIILGLDPNLTLAILPNTPHGTETAIRAAALGFEIMLHMPMENLDPALYPHEGQLNVAMPEYEIRLLTESALAQVPGAVGVNNHMGSLFTADAKAMALFMSAIEGRGLYFVDSRTTPNTKAFDIARAFQVPAAQRDLFLDHEDDVTAIRHRFEQAVGVALEMGQAIAICHFRPTTASVLPELLAGLEATGVHLVHVSELIP